MVAQHKNHMEAIKSSAAHHVFQIDENIDRVFEPYVEPIWAYFVHSCKSRSMLTNIVSYKVHSPSPQQLDPPLRDGVSL